MKTKLLLCAALLAVSFQFINAQCVVSGTFVANSPNTMTYPIEGDANITVNPDGTVASVNFESDFVSVQGFQLAVYLSKTQTIDTDPISNPNPTTFIRVDQSGDLLDDLHNSAATGHDGHAMSGAKAFTQNLAGVSKDEYQYVILQCIEFHVPWGYAELTNETPDCSTLSVDENTLLNTVSFYPNPTSNTIEISNDKQLNLNVTIFNVLGKIVLETKNTTLRKQTINLSSLNSGVYLIQLKAEGKTITKKLVKQ